MAKIMIVEDETLIRFALADTLIDQGQTVIECANVLEAVGALGRHDDIDAVVTDVDMPGGLTGIDLARLLERTRPSVPVWITSGRSVDLSSLANAISFLEKPYDMSKLVHDIVIHLDRPRSRLNSRPHSRSSSLG
jgi:DNA-binding NtrC family response regulator